MAAQIAKPHHPSSPRLCPLAPTRYICCGRHRYLRRILVLRPGGDNRLDSGFYNLLSQSLLTLLASYCTLLPILHDTLTRQHFLVKLPVPTRVFYLLVLATISTAVAAPIAYAKLPGDDYAVNIGNTMNFISSFSAVVTASQLAGGIMRI